MADKLKQAELQYLAGVFDARGKFYVYSHRNVAGSKKSYRQVRVRVHSSDGGWLALLHDLTGSGSLSGTRGKGRAETHTWTVLGQQAVILLKQVLPFMQNSEAVGQAEIVVK